MLLLGFAQTMRYSVNDYPCMYVNTECVKIVLNKRQLFHQWVNTEASLISEGHDFYEQHH